MDIARPSNARRKRIKQVAYAGAGLVAVLLITLGLSRLKPAAPSVEGATVWRDTVKRGPMLREVRGLGTLVPEDIRWIPATTLAGWSASSYARAPSSRPTASSSISAT